MVLHEYLHRGGIVAVKRGEKVGRWPGGYVWRGVDGRETYWLERRVAGRRYHVSTRTHALRAAMKHLERFEADPEGYRPEGVALEAPLVITPELAAEFWRWQVQTKGGTVKHANAFKNRLADWAEDLGEFDLRKLTLRDHVKPALDRRGTMRGFRIACLKAFYGWLRKEKHLLTSAQDPMIDLPIPQSTPEKRRRRKAVEIARVEAVLPHLAPHYRDLLMVGAATGFHTTELERMIRSSESEILHVRRGTTVGVIVVRHKNGEIVRTGVTDPETLAAAERLRQRARMPKRPNDALRLACRTAGVAEFTFGVLRHSVATWLGDRGMTREQIGEFLHHKDPRTTDTYIDVEIPTVPVELPRFRVVKSD